MGSAAIAAMEGMLQTDPNCVAAGLTLENFFPSQGMSALQVRSGAGSESRLFVSDDPGQAEADKAALEKEAQAEVAAEADAARETEMERENAVAENENEVVKETNQHAIGAAKDAQMQAAGGSEQGVGLGSCLPPSTSQDDNGYNDAFRGWYDVQGCGQCHDFCRWVGGSGSGGDPLKQVFHNDSFWSCRLAGGSQTYSWRGYFDAWNLSRCLSQGDVAPPSPPVPTPYVPGQPGAAWSKEDLLRVRAKLHRVFTEGGAMVYELGLVPDDELWTSQPSAAKCLRLGFHDCLKYTDGTGGCDGCLEWNGVGTRFPRTKLARGLFPFTDDGHNNGLKPTVEVLEAIYTDRGFPGRSPPLPISLQQSGKSRADLWAFAALVAVEYSITLNNHVCDGPSKFAPEQCHPRVNMSDCKVELPRPFSFKTGRRDCVSTGAPWKNSSSPSFMTQKEERHPDPQSNGSGTVEFFRRDFGFTGRETVAIMGAHTIGRVHVILSLFRYTWKARSGRLFNNGYYRNLASKRDWFFPSGEKECVTVGNANGERPEARWVAHVRGDTTVGGPVQWLQEKLVCPTCSRAKTGSKQHDCCTNGVPEGGHCRPGCETWRFVSGLDEQALSCEYGLYRAFEVDGNGIPKGCRGLEDFNMDKWGGFKTPEEGLKNYNPTWSKIDGEEAEPQCPFNTLAEPAGTTPVYQIIDEYAENTMSFLSDFVPTLEKMLANGYAESSMVATPAAGMSGVFCPLQDPHDHDRFYTCGAIPTE